MKGTSGCLPLASTQTYTSESNSPPHAHIHAMSSLVIFEYIIIGQGMTEETLSIKTSWIHEDMVVITCVHSLRQ